MMQFVPLRMGAGRREEGKGRGEGVNELGSQIQLSSYLLVVVTILMLYRTHLKNGGTESAPCLGSIRVNVQIYLKHIENGFTLFS